MRLVLQATGLVALTALAVVVAASFGKLVGTVAKTEYVKLPGAPARANGGAYTVGTVQATVVLVLLEGADERDVRALPSLRRVWLESRFVPHTAPDARASSVLATLLTGIDLGPFLFHPVNQLLARPDLRRLLGDADALVARLARGGVAVRLYGYRMLQDFLGVSVTKLPIPTPEFQDADASQSAARLQRVSRGTGGPTEGFHLVEIALPPRSAGMARGGVLDKIDDAIDRLRQSMQPRQLLIVAGTEAADELTPEVPVLFVGKGVAAGEMDPRPLADLGATVCMALGAPRPSRGFGVPDVDLWQRDDRRAVPVLQAVVRDRAAVADAVARDVYGATIALPVERLERAAAVFLKGDAPGARKLLEELLADQDAQLAALRVSSRSAAVATAPAPIRPKVLAGVGVGVILLGVVAAPSVGVLIAGLSLLAIALVVGARAEAALFAFDPYALGPGELGALYRSAAVWLAPVVLAWMGLAAVSRRAPASSLLALWNVGGGAAALRLGWFLAYNGFTPGPSSPGTLALRTAVVAGAALVAGPVVLWPAFLALVPLERRRAAAPRSDPT